MSYYKKERAIWEKYVAAGACSPVEIKRSGNKAVVLYGDDQAATDQKRLLWLPHNKSGNHRLNASHYLSVPLFVIKGKE